MTPFLELYVTLERTEEEENKYIIEEPVEGFPLVAAVLFQEGIPIQYQEDENAGRNSEDGHGKGTTVMLRMSYLLPKVLHEFAGCVAVYGDVDKKLTICMSKMKDFIENVDIEELERVRVENEAEIRANFAEQNQMKAEGVRRHEERIRRWEQEIAAAANQENADGMEEISEVSAELGNEQERTAPGSNDGKKKNPGIGRRGRRKKTET